MGATTTTTTLIFTYGTLKKGFSNHYLVEDLISTGDASFLGVYQTLEPFPLVCGPYRVPFLLNFPGSGHRVRGELYAVSTRALAKMDELEGTSRGHYERLPIKVEVFEENESRDNPTTWTEAEAEAEAYYAHRSYAEQMWKRNGEKGYSVYSDKEAIGYIPRKDRPQHLTFLDHIRIFMSTTTTTTSADPTTTRC